MPVSILVNDLHSELNPSMVQQVLTVRSESDVQHAIGLAARTGQKVSICGGRHAMGGQQFGSDSILIDTTLLNQVIEFDSALGTITVGGGMQWPQLIDYLCERSSIWTIAQKQTGCDNLSIGGAISANVHGRGLKMKPFISDVESFRLVCASGEILTCSRTENQELFALAAGGYGLFGPIVSAKIKLAPKVALQRLVEIVDCTQLIEMFDERRRAGFLYGDFQFSIDEASDDFLRKGLLSAYVPVSADEHSPSNNVSLSTEQWKELLFLAHTNKRHAFDLYAKHYMATNGQVYWSDRFQLATYVDGYHKQLDPNLGQEHLGTEIITEIYVPRMKLADFLLAARDVFKSAHADLIYGTVRLIEKDDESFLAWAKEPFACIIFNLHTEHTDAGIERSSRAFRGLIDLATAFGGSYYLTYHKYASRKQLDKCYPQFAKFLAKKLEYDADEMFSSDWYRHYKLA